MAHPATPTFWLEPTDEVAVGLRRYRSTNAKLTCEDGYHSALRYIGRAPARWRDTDHGRVIDTQPPTPRDDPRWPLSCRCGYVFADDDVWQDWQELLYQRADTGEVVTLRGPNPAAVDAPPSAPPGATWSAWWMPASWRGPDGIALMVRLPDGHDWHVDGPAANCTRKGEPHRCWVRHGDPRQAAVTVDKSGDTCSAGGGSIASDGYHGFLTSGVLTAG